MNPSALASMTPSCILQSERSLIDHLNQFIVYYILFNSTGLIMPYTHNLATSSKGNNSLNNSLLLACKKGDAESVKRLLDAPDIEVNKADDSGITPLSRACVLGRAEIINLLLKHPGIKVNLADNKGNTPLSRACALGRTGIVNLLLGHPEIKINKTNFEGNMPLSWACLRNYTEILFFLLQDRKLHIPSNPVDEITKCIHQRIKSILQATCETNNEELKKCATLLYMRGYQPEDLKNNNLYQNWLLFKKNKVHLFPNEIISATHPISTLQELCLFTINNHNMEKTEVPKSLLHPSVTMIEIIDKFFCYLANKERWLQETEEQTAPTSSL